MMRMMITTVKEDDDDAHHIFYLFMDSIILRNIIRIHRKTHCS